MKLYKNIRKTLIILFAVFIQFVFIPVAPAYAATSPTLGAAATFSVLGGTTVTCTGSTTLSGGVGVSPGSSITGFPSPCSAGGGTHSNDASAIAAQADNLTAFGAIDQTCDHNYGAQDLTLISPLGPGVYCSSSAFTLSGNLTLTGSGVWIFKSVSTLITSPGSSVTGGDACNVWWRVGSAATLDTTTSFIGNILALSGIQMNSGATLSGRALAQSGGAVTLSSNTITAPTCQAAAAPTPAPLTPAGAAPPAYCPPLDASIVSPSVIETRRVSPTSMFVSWGPYSGTNKFNVQYGTTSSNWLYNTDVTGFSTTINNLSPNQPIWVRVAPRSNCTIGKYGPSSMAGTPGLPNTGFKPELKNILVAIMSLGLLGLTYILLKRFSK